MRAPAAPRSADGPRPLEGTVIDGYRVLRKVGEGGVGAVYEAVSETDKQSVAIKVLHREFSDQRDVTTRFFNEARAVKVIRHPGLVDIQCCSELPDGTAYMIMEFLRGESLQSRLKEAGGRLPITKVLDICMQVADTLVATHDKGIVHRDQ